MPFYHHFHNFLTRSDTPATGFLSFLGGFSGAFFAFAFGIITYVITKRRERLVIHKNALVKLERALNKHLHDLGVLERILTDNNRILGQGHVTSNRLIKLQMPEGIDSDLASADLINKLFIYQLSLDRINFNSETTNHSLNRLEDIFLSGQTPHVTNFNMIRTRSSSLLQELPQFNKRIKRFLVLTRIHISKLKNKNTFMHGVFHTQWEWDITSEEIAAERAKLDEEIRTGANIDF